MSKIVCVYHAHCADGLGAAWAVHRALGDEVEFVAAKYGGDHLDIRLKTLGGVSYVGRDVLYVDFSDPLPTLRAMTAEARGVLVLDHHKTAQENLVEIQFPRDKYNFRFKDWLETGGYINGNLAAIFDLNRSGAGLTWDYLHPDAPRPRIIDLIEDRDLWRFRFGDETRAFHAVLTSYDIMDLPAMFRKLDIWAGWADDPTADSRSITRRGAWGDVLAEGHAIIRAQRQAVAAAVAASHRTIRIAGHVVPCACVPGSASV